MSKIVYTVEERPLNGQVVTEPNPMKDMTATKIITVGDVTSTDPSLNLPDTIEIREDGSVEAQWTSYPSETYPSLDVFLDTYGLLWCEVRDYPQGSYLEDAGCIKHVIVLSDEGGMFYRHMGKGDSIEGPWANTKEALAELANSEHTYEVVPHEHTDHPDTWLFVRKKDLSLSLSEIIDAATRIADTLGDVSLLAREEGEPLALAEEYTAWWEEYEGEISDAQFDRLGPNAADRAEMRERLVSALAAEIERRRVVNRSLE